MLLEAMRAQFAVVLEVVTPLRQDVSEIKETLATHGSRFDTLEGQMSGVISTLREHTATLSEHTADIRELKADVKEIKADLKEVKQIVAGHAEAITELQAR